MALDVEESLTRALHDCNPWWDGGSGVFDLPDRPRSDFYHIARPDGDGTQVDEQRVLGLAGRRGVGKTTLVYEFIRHRIEVGDAPERFCYLPLDENPLFQLRSDEQIGRALRYYESRILARLEEQDRHVILLDDVHRVEHRDKPDTRGWAEVVASALEGWPARRIVVTASAGIQISRALEAAGLEPDDTHVQPILPEKFRDYLFSLEPDLERGDDRISPTPLREGESSIPRALETGDPGPVAEELRQIHSSVAPVTGRIQTRLLAYLAMGGILSLGHDGAIEGVEDIEQAAVQRLRDDVRYALYQEVPDFEPIKQIADLERLCTLAATERARTPLSIRECADAFDVDRRTLMDSYLPALETLYVLSGITEYDNSRPRTVRLYLRDPGLVSALTGSTPAAVAADFEREGDLARLVGFDHSMRLEYMLSVAAETPREPTVQFWRGADAEVEYVLTVEDVPLPVGLAYRPSALEGTNRALRSFMDQYDVPLALCLVGDTVETGEPVSLEEGVITLPYWLYVLLC